MGVPLFSKSMSVVIDGSTLGCASDFSLQITKDMIEVACLDSTGAKQQVPDLYGWNVTFSGMVLRTSTVGTDINYDALANKIISSDASVGVYILPDVSANKYLIGGGYLSSLSMDGGVGAPVTFSGEIVGSGPLTQTQTT